MKYPQELKDMRDFLKENHDSKFISWLQNGNICFHAYDKKDLNHRITVAIPLALICAWEHLTFNESKKNNPIFPHIVNIWHEASTHSERFANELRMANSNFFNLNDYYFKHKDNL